jgi:hypothetical protein
MDEITLFKAIAPPPPGDAETIRQGARDRLAAAMSAPPRPARHRRRPLALAGAAAAAGALAASGILLSTGGQAPRGVHVNLAAWSVNTNPNGTVTVKMKNISDPSRLEHVLAEAGIPALVRWGEVCWAPPAQYLPTAGIVNGPDYVGGTAPPVLIRGLPYPNVVWTFTPSSMPAGARYMITAVPVNRVPPNRGGMMWGLIRDGAHLTCGSSVPPGAG